MRSPILFGLCVISIVLTGCVSRTPLDDCRMSHNGYEVYVGNSVYYNCTLFGGGCASHSGCTFTNCEGFNLGDNIHSNEYIKRCP